MRFQLLIGRIRCGRFARFDLIGQAIEAVGESAEPNADLRKTRLCGQEP